jgi:hypothetical protein
VSTETRTEAGAGADARGRGRGPRRIDPLLPISCLVALAVYLPHGFDGFLSRDLGLYSYGGQQVAEGVPPYVAALNRAGPLAQLVPGIGASAARAVGVDDVLGMRVLFLLLTLGCIGVAYLLGRDVFRSRAAGLVCAASILSFQGVATYATYGPREKTTLLLFVLCTLLALARQRWATTGCFIALATLTWQPVFLAALGGTLVAVLVGLRTGRRAALVRVAVGGLVPTVVTVATYAVAGAWQVFWDDFLLINMRYTEQDSLSGDPLHIWTILTEGYGWSLWVFIIGSVALVAASVAKLRDRALRRSAPSAALAAGTTILVLGVLWSLKAFNGFPDNFFMLPGSALGMAAIVAALRRRVSVRTATAAALAWVVAVTAMALFYSIDKRNDTLDEQRRDVTAVMSLLPKDARILSIAAPQPLVLTHERNLTRLQIFSNGITPYLDDTWPGGRDGYGAWIGRRAPTVIAVGDGEPPQWLVPTLDRSYRAVGESPGWRWYVNTDVGESTLRALAETLSDS